MSRDVVRGLKACLLGGASALVVCGAAAAQEPPKSTEDPVIAQTPPPAAQPQPPRDRLDREAAQTGQAEDAEVEEVVVVGSQIRGARVTDALPVTVLDAEDIETTAATSGDELFRSIPQAGDVGFTESRQTGGINDARGDTASINLRALGTGNTLVLINGRRMVLHPGTQSENLVPVTTVNVNTIPVMGVRRLEVLREGAAAIYGTDAVAGVVNTVLKNNFEGFTIQLEGGFSESTNFHESDGSFEAGRDFNGGATNISVFGAFTSRNPMYARERRYSRFSDLRPLLAGTPFASDTDFLNTSTDTPWTEGLRLNPGTFTRATAATTVGGQSLTTATNNAFHVQPSTNPGCIAPGQAPGVCYDNATLATTGEDANLRYNDNEERTLIGQTERYNLFTFLNHEFGNGLELFGEVGVFFSDYRTQREQDTPLGAQRIILPANAYYNPLGSGPGRIPGLGTSVPAAGVPVELQDYRPIDVGPQLIHVEQWTTRYLAGLRGEWRGFDWESALLYSRADVDDTMNAVSLTAFQAAVSRTTPDAYNPFSGGDPANPSEGDPTRNSPETIRSMLVDVSRVSSTSIALADFRVSRPDLWTLWAGPIGVATGVEFRHETFEDDRDPRLDGTIRFIDLAQGGNGSDVMGVSPTPDTQGERDVASAFIELAVPLVSPEMNIPLVRSLDVQLAARAEHYSEFGSVTKPKIALSWYPVEWLQIRTALSQGFRAPNLPQLFERGIQRTNTRTDWIRCEADLRKPAGAPGKITNFDQCAESLGVVSNRSGSTSLTPEESESFNVGVVFQSTFVPKRFGELVFTMDYWKVEQTDIVGIFGDANAVILDYLLRVQGSSNPNVIRGPVGPEDEEDFAGSGLTPAGPIIQVIDNYTNLTPREVEGLDFGLFYELDDTPFGDFDFKLNAAKLLTFFQQPGALQAQLLAAKAAGVINQGVTILGAEDLIRQNGRPEWRWTTSLTWRKGPFGAGLFSTYVGDVLDTSATLADGTIFQVDEWLTHNAYVQVSLENLGYAEDARLRLGVRNLTDEDPPIADTELGFLGELHSARGRFWYASLRVGF